MVKMFNIEGVFKWGFDKTTNEVGEDFCEMKDTKGNPYTLEKTFSIGDGTSITMHYQSRDAVPKDPIFPQEVKKRMGAGPEYLFRKICETRTGRREIDVSYDLVKEKSSKLSNN
ncbi:MAG: hypothetical protein ABIF85_05045 [Nanoarchaeota archaeon]|nr:hypothetical protein [Nanoarchaeota archaeon]MBU4452345.1 hypothetical protein [Nanoarchaeota archaeon]MCG2723378.1 hypothetical protein [archaeon]